MHGIMMYMVEKGFIKAFELGMEICLQATATGAICIGNSGGITGILMGRDKEETKLFGWQEAEDQKGLR